MVRDVRYITLSSSYRDLQEALVTGQLKTLALVESKGETCIKYLTILRKKSCFRPVSPPSAHPSHQYHNLTLGIFRQTFRQSLSQSVFFPHFSHYGRAILLKCLCNISL